MTMLNFRFCPRFLKIPKLIFSRHNLFKLFKQGTGNDEEQSTEGEAFFSHVGTNYMQEKLSLKQQ